MTVKVWSRYRILHYVSYQYGGELVTLFISLNIVRCHAHRCHCREARGGICKDVLDAVTGRGATRLKGGRLGKSGI